MSDRTKIFNDTRLKQLAERAMACPLWKWWCDMQVVHPAEHEGATGFTFRLTSDGYVARPGEYPDFSDELTLRRLQSLIEIHLPYMMNKTDDHVPFGYVMSHLGGGPSIGGLDKADVLVRALETSLQEPQTEAESSKGKRGGVWLTVRVPDALAARLNNAGILLREDTAMPAGHTKSSVLRAVLMVGLDAVERKARKATS